MKESVAEFYRQVLSLTDEALLQKLISVTELHCLSKRDILIREGQPLNYIYFLVSGIFREWVLDANGRDITDCFSFRYGEPVICPMHLSVLIRCPAMWEPCARQCLKSRRLMKNMNSKS